MARLTEWLKDKGPWIDRILVLGVVLLAAISLWGAKTILYAGSIHYWATTAPNTGQAAATLHLDRDDITLSMIVLFGLFLTVLLMIALGIVYKWMSVEDPAMPLALPDGSIRALLAFSLVLIFVCVSAFLFSAVEMKPCDHCGIELKLVTKAEILDLQKDFVVSVSPAKVDGKPVYEQKPNPARTKKPEDKSIPETIDDTDRPLYNVVYYPKLGKDATDLAKQIFTTLASIFISVVSFYFGSSVTASATKAANLGDKSGTAALKDSHDASLNVKKAQDDYDAAAKIDASSTDAIAKKVALDKAKHDEAVKQGVAERLINKSS